MKKPKFENGGWVNPETTQKLKEKLPKNTNEFAKALREIDGIMKEKEIERQCVQLARRHGWDAWKNENNGNKGIPDYSFLKDGHFIMVEFKRSATAHVRPEQLTWQARHPETVFFCHDLETFTKILGL
ncbi:MAG: hypothetical protein J6T33_09765 [Bacteroidales bacterium]|nr:hypothetical protein [Bacteroidales bacterium]